MKAIYDNVYSEVDDYDSIFQYKIDVINKTFSLYDNSIKIIDVGCGKGHYLKNFLNHGFNNILGIEFSEVCSKNFLYNLPHLNKDFLEYAHVINDQEYDVCLCMDVIEHISLENLDEFLKSIARISKESVLGIANHSDMLLGQELHLIQENIEWWGEKLKSFYLSIDLVYTHDSRFFIFKCKN